MKVLFAAYRDWAYRAVWELRSHPAIDWYDQVSTAQDLEQEILRGGRTYDLVVLCGWSWQVSQELLAKVTVVSEHPAYLDEYSLGTPLQNQILDGITLTKHRVVKIGYPELGERLYSPAHEVPMSLEGGMDEVLEAMRVTAVEIYRGFLTDYPNVTWKRWPKATSYRVPRRPHDSNLLKDDVVNLTTKQLYDRIRMLGNPYPNAYVEDGYGRLFFERVRFEPK